MDTGKILLMIVEDDHLQANALKEFLVERGFEVVTAAKGIEAIKGLECVSSGISGLITDIRLGSGPSGWDVGERARELYPTMPVVYVSGDSSTNGASRAVIDSVMIKKPFAEDQVLTAISTLLNSATVATSDL